MAFELLPTSGMPRRALFIMPFTFGAMVALCRRSERVLPHVTDDGTGPVVPVADFSGSGQRETELEVRKIEKTKSEWRQELTADEYAITRNGGTEFAFSNRYWNVKDGGIYRCVCCGNALFRSQDKFNSGTGWPSFSAPVAEQNIYTKRDASLSLDRTEVLCRKCDAHLGHVFADGPPPKGLRYCLNSTALRLIKYA